MTAPMRPRKLSKPPGAKPRARKQPAGNWWDGWQPGDLGWTRSAGFVGAAIQFGERVRYQGWFRTVTWTVRRLLRLVPAPGQDDPGWGNHIFVHLGDGQIIEALAGGLIAGHITKYPPARVRRLPLNQAAAAQDITPNLAAGLAFARAELAAGDKYGWLSIASIVIQLTSPEKLDISWGRAMICSAYGARVWEHMGLRIPVDNPYTAYPSTLDRMIPAGP